MRTDPSEWSRTMADPRLMSVASRKPMFPFDGIPATPRFTIPFSALKDVQSLRHSA